MDYKLEDRIQTISSTCGEINRILLRIAIKGQASKDAKDRLKMMLQIAHDSASSIETGSDK